MFAAQEKSLAPWLQGLWDNLDFSNFPNATLLHGQSGIGKFSFALELAKSLLCESVHAASRPCKQCEACHWFDSGNHPDFIALVPETHRKLLPHGDFETDGEAPKKSKSARDESDGDVAEKKEKKNISIEETRSAIEGLSIGTHRGYHAC